MNSDLFFQVLTAIGAVCGVVVLVVGAYVMIKGSYARARINALKEDNDLLRSRLDDADKELVKCGVREDKLEDRVEHLERENDLLKEMVLQRGDLERLFTALNNHNTKALEALGRVEAALTAGRGGTTS